MDSEMSRRSFLEQCGRTAAITGALATPGLLAARQSRAPAAGATKSAGDRIRVGFIGLGGRSRDTAAAFVGQPDVEPAAFCDCYITRAQSAATALAPKAEVYSDFRRVLDRKDIDAVSISTPDHWHALISILACQSGKDVYVEKPLARTVAEGRAMVQAARRHSRIVQAGTQCRSSDHFVKAKEIIQSGRIGRVVQARAWICSHWPPEGIGRPADQAPPEGLDWEMWQGPARRHAFNPARFKSFRQFWDYAGGSATDRGIHLLDIVMMCLGVEYPGSVSSSGGRYTFEDLAETPDTQQILYEIDSGGRRLLMSWEHREANNQPIEGRGLGMAFYGSDATLVADYRGFVIYPDGKRQEAVSEKGALDDRKHVRNFLDCVRSRERPVADFEYCHRTTTATLIGNIALRLGRKLRWDGRAERFHGDSEANRLLRPVYTKPWKLPKT